MGYNRFGERVNDVCQSSSLPAITPDLASHIRDNHPLGLPYDTRWTVRDAFASTVALDDLSAMYRFNLFGMLGSRVIDADDENDERAFRRLYSSLFQTNYLGRQMDCLPRIPEADADVVDSTQLAVDSHR